MTEPRPAKPTLRFVDEYCDLYQDLFPEVRSYEAFRYLHVGMLSDIKRKTLPAIARIVGLNDSQPLQYFLTESGWDIKQLRDRRLEVILDAIGEREIILIIDETGDRKKGRTTDYVQRQYIGNLGKVEQGIVAVTAFGVLDHMTFPLMFSVFRPKACLKSGDSFRTKPEIAAQLVKDLIAQGFRFKLVLADSLYGESDSNFLSVLRQFSLEYVVAIRSNHGVWLPKGQRVRCNRWRRFQRVFSNGQAETRYIREVIYGQRHTRQYWQITTDPETLPAVSTWDIMTCVAGITYREVGNFYGVRNWVEYGLKQSKNELGWADFRVTDYTQIEKWWELVMSAYLLVSLHSQQLNEIGSLEQALVQHPITSQFRHHPGWNLGQGWKNLLNNLRLILQPWVLFNLIKPWLDIFTIKSLRQGFSQLIAIMNHLPGATPHRMSRASPSLLSAQSH